MRLTFSPNKAALSFRSTWLLPRELDDRAKRDRAKIVFGLRFAQWVRVNRFSVDQFPVVTKGCCGELQHGLVQEVGFTTVPRRCFDVVRLINEQGLQA